MVSMPDPVAAAFDAFPDADRALLMQAREMLFELAETAGVGPLAETLKWGQPAYLTEKSKAGTTVRLGLGNGGASVFLNCQTNLVDGYRRDFPDAFDYTGSRALHLAEPLNRKALALCLRRALTYHRDKKKAV